MQSITDFRPNPRVLNEFVRWIEQPQFNPLHAKAWAKRYKNDPEGAMCEASVWAVLHDCGVTVEPNPNTTPDFLCWNGGVKFYVEVTCIQVETATRKTNLRPIPEIQKATSYQSLNEAIRGESINKTGKCANLDAPCVLAIGTFHPNASALAVNEKFMEWLHTDPCIGMDFDPRAGQIVGEPYQVARLRKSVFRQLFEVGGVHHVRRPISALIVGGFGYEPPRLFGLLNPAPAREFDPRLLARIPFCVERADILKGQISVEWIQTGENEEISRESDSAGGQPT
jgi:hypothetical protein